ncbi:zinc finger protein GLIS2 homolog [Rhagoletis pomonella]|uniref:zinc finger protein GLIS2 homolog n=1 Tax=Rhagoletis pomonella TaxID=28610 RepID=UPI001786A732|nr:zinc finger protein GLIS2 homolog [Rhagoletis pomonella]
MAVQNSKFPNSVLNSAFVPTSAYYQHLSAASAAIAAYEGWSHLDFLSTQLAHTSSTPPDELLQMHHLRFPTPPITPPYKNSAYMLGINPHTKATRTRSVIMKIGQDQLDSNLPPTPEHVDDMAVDIVGLDDVATSAAALRHEAMTTMTTTTRTTPTSTSTTSSASSTPQHSEYVCEWSNCGRDHNTLEALAGHVTKVHAVASPADGLYYCRWIGCTRMRGFSARYKMLVHARTHTKEKPHQCHLCAKSFSRAENLKIHIRSHSGEKPYLCTYEGCNKAYSNSSDRFKHTRTHAMDKPYMCKVPGCQKRYTDPSSLRKHVKTFKHAVQLIGTAAVTPMKSAMSGGGMEMATAAQAVGGAAVRQTHRSSLISSPMQNVVNTAGNHHLHANAYSNDYSEAASPRCQLCVPPPPAPHYYLNAMEEDICNIKAAQLDYYYATTAGHSQARSSSAASNCWSNNTHSGSESAPVLAMELDTPLDLRVNRS